MKQDTLILVVGKDSDAEGYIGNQTKISVRKAVELFKAGKAGTILMSGGWSFHLKEKPANTEADGMKQYAVSLGVPPDVILKEEQSMDTTGNAFYSMDIVAGLPHIKNIILVTVDYHMPRVRFIFEEAFGGTYHMTYIEADSGYTEEQLRRKRESESKTLNLLHVLYDKVPHKDFRETMLRTHPLYGKDPSTIPEAVWKGYEDMGITREYLISRFMKPKTKVS